MEERNRSLVMKGEEDSRVQAQWVSKNIDGRMIVVGVCAMAKKTNSKPMKEILGRLNKFEHLQIIVFEEAMILNDPVDTWPVVDALISFFSNGFPLQKAIEYKNLRRPFVVNDLEAQYILFDRREVYKILVREGVAHPRYAILNRNSSEEGLSDHFEENEDAIEVNGVTFQRPFVEKPVCAEDHNIYIYFPVSAGGGCQKLFRKVGSRSSVYSTINRVRKTGSYVYEDFMPTDGTDVKVYTVGPDYAHAEARKSPALDGKVERDKDGKEIRYPVLLSASEKMTARKVCMAFKQNVCGFDLLRANGKSYVCDVNGFSFVKNSTKYYDDCANVLGTMIVRALAPQLHIPLVLGAAPEDIPVVHTTSGSMMELRCVVAIIRHGDRTPKQKMKMEVKNKKFFELFEKYGGYKSGHLKLKKPKQLQEVLDIARDLLAEGDLDHDLEVQEKKAKLRQLKLVLEMYGHFSGINRKVQLKYQPRGAPKRSSSEEDEHPREPSLVLIVKWGGELTPAGKFQAEDLGKAFRTLYPGGQGEFETPGLGFLRLHSTFRHDLKIYASDEGRVQMTAAAFTKGLLALEGELTPILVSMVKSANTNGLLDKEGETSKYQHVVKEKLMEILNEDREFTGDDTEKLCPTKSKSLLDAMRFIENPRRLCDHVFEMVRELTARIKMLKMELKSRDLKLYHGESWELLIRRWAKLEKDFKNKSGNYDISKIPDIYDCIKYDLQHNQKTLQYERAEELFMYSKALADIVIPQEYGIKVEEKLHISQSICTPLLRKIHSDLLQVCQQNAEEEGTRLNSKYSKGVASPERFVRTRLYFTSESHIHSLLNMFRYGGLIDASKDEQWRKATDFLSMTSELNYMTQINIMMFEDPSKEFNSPERFHVELHFSPGAYTSCDTDVMNPVSSGYRTIFHSRQMKKSDDGHKLADNGKKDGIIHDGIIQESISEVGSQEELFHSKEDSESRPCVYRLHVHETETSMNHLGDRSVNKPLILIDKVMKSDIGIPHNDKATAVADIDSKESTAVTASHVDNKERGIAATAAQPQIVTKHGFETDHNQKKMVEDKAVGTSTIDATANKVGKGSIATTACQVEVQVEDYSVSEVTLCPENDTDVSKQHNPGSDKVFGKSLDDAGYAVMIKGDQGALSGAEGKMEARTDEMKSKLSGSGMENRNEKLVATDFEGSDNDNTRNNVAFGEKLSDKGEVEKIRTEIDKDMIKSDETSDNRRKTDEFVKENDSADKEMEDIGQQEDLLGRKVFTIGSQDDLDELVDSLHDDDDRKKTDDEEECVESVPEPRSPDPDIPEWDWGEDNPKSQEQVLTLLNEANESRHEKTKKTSDQKSTQPKGIPIRDQPTSGTTHDAKPKSHGSKKDSSQGSPSAVSRPLTIEVRSATDRRRTGSFDCLKTYEEGRSRSLEDKMDDGIALMEKHYLTIHLPINKDRHHHSFSSLLYLNPEAFKDGYLAPPAPYLLGSYSLPDLSASVENQAFDGFNMVPSLKPLETLHNNLTLKEMDAFLSRATTTKFFTPVSSPLYGATPLMSPRLPEAKRDKSGSGQSLSSAQSLPSSNSSSAGPSSPTSVSTPVDFFSKLKMFMLDPQKIDQYQYSDIDLQAVSESDLPSFSSSASEGSIKSGFPYVAGIKSDAPCGNSSVPKVQNNQSSVKSGNSNPREKLEIQSEDCKGRTVRDALTPDEKTATSCDNDEHEKTLTAKSSDVSRSLKLEMGQGLGTGQDCDKLANDFRNQVIVSAGELPTSPARLSERIPPELGIDVNQDTHKSAFKKVGKRFKMTHVPEESLKLETASSTATVTENVSLKSETENVRVAFKKVDDKVDASAEELDVTVEKATETSQYTSRDKLEKGENKKLKVKSGKNCNVSANVIDSVN